MNRKLKPQFLVRGRGFFLLLLLATFVFALASSAAADDLTKDDEYSFEPIVLSEVLSEDGESVTVDVLFPVVADTFITSSQPDRNWGGDPNLRLGYNMPQFLNLGAERILMRFDFSTIPQTAQVNWAKFQVLMTESNPVTDPPLAYSARFLNSSWNEFQVTWNNHQPDWGSVFATGSVNNVLGWKEGDTTDLVREWVNAGRPNYGFTFIANESVAQHERVFTSREVGDGNFPRMIVSYDISTDTTPPTSSMTPLPTFSRDSFIVQWSGVDNPGGSGLDHYDVQYQANGGTWVNWLTATRDTQATFIGGANGATYGFRVRAVDNAGNQEQYPPAAETQTTVDTIAPSAATDPLPQYTPTPNFTVSWSGSDNQGGSGIATYDLQYQINGGDWQFYLVGTTQTSVEATGIPDGTTIGVRVRATDNAGNVQAWSPTAQSSTTVSLVPTAWVNWFNPPYTSADSFSVSWGGAASPPATVTSFDVRYQIDNGSWQTWLSSTTNISELFDVSSMPDGTYYFSARATDSLGRTGEWSDGPFMIVRRSGNFFENFNFMPIMFNQLIP